MRYIFPLLAALCLWGCGGARQMATLPELQQWVGTWQGKGIRENRMDPVRDWTLTLEIRNNRLTGHLQDQGGEMGKQNLKKVRLQDGVLTFQLNFESTRGLQVTYSHEARLRGDKILSVFHGREGGRPFQGKWEAVKIAEGNTVAN
ncbi:MAG: hypothetical protein ONB48_09880 [candidate division KSB1 bacterium]|nr:hypothetical protein [candidate division KSB1 bacterium]MDZ7273796.1 hypothetical protein [candidate division KSB1 bacterium]MDZ7285952.1 hypothetical protein [candidate division KSB1 bacterium]MDZ7298984.1 hypothetical protein [candidate division KSB1 bacterium]MDZ7309169.1 hypothetical protein [candidate division KSB1 bacterium]